MSVENGAYKPSCVFDIIHAMHYSSNNPYKPINAVNSTTECT